MKANETTEAIRVAKKNSPLEVIGVECNSAAETEKAVGISRQDNTQPFA